MRSFFLLVFYGLFLGSVYAQQTPASHPFMPKDPGEAINSSAHELNPLLSEDGLTLYFVRADHPENKFGVDGSQDIWVSIRPDLKSPWSEAKRLPDEINRIQYNALYAVLDSGQTFIIAGRFGKKSLNYHRRGLSMIKKNTDGSFSQPMRLKIPRYERKNKGTTATASFHSDGSLMAVGMSKNFESFKQRLYLSQLKPNGKWSKLKKVKVERPGYSNESPFFSQDKKTLYFSALRKGGKGDYDLYKIQALYDKYKTWSTPELLSDTLNSTAWEGYYRENSKGSYAAFATSNQSRAEAADIRLVKRYEEKPWFDLKIKLVDSRNGMPLDVKYSPKLLVLKPGQAAEEINIGDSLTNYQQPLKNKYSFSAQVNYFKADTIEVDLEKELENGTRELVVTATPFPYVDVNLKMQSTDPSKPFALTKLKLLTANSAAVPSPQYDYSQGRVKFQLKHGSNYRIEAMVNDFIARPLELPLSNVNEYQTIDTIMRLRPEEVKAVVVKLEGYVIDKKTGKPLNRRKPFDLLVNDTIRMNESADTISPGIYALSLLPGRIYVLGVQRRGYASLFDILDLRTAKASANLKKDLTVVPLEVGQSIKINNILFETGKATIQKSSFPELDRLAEFLNDYEIKAEIAGHTDNVGKAASNLKLSDDRAKSVVNYLVSKGVESSKLSFKGYGMTKPVADNKTAKGKAENRRVEFTVLDIVLEE
jgi:outer membrane protein OmpA-like peptidoglycan-associated protein